MFCFKHQLGLSFSTKQPNMTPDPKGSGDSGGSGLTVSRRATELLGTCLPCPPNIGSRNGPLGCSKHRIEVHWARVLWSGNWLVRPLRADRKIPGVDTVTSAKERTPKAPISRYLPDSEVSYHKRASLCPPLGKKLLLPPSSQSLGPKSSCP